jgi:ribosomal protein L23
VFVFNVRQDATKERIAAAIKESYKVTPRKINIVTMKPKRVISARRKGVGFTAGGKKAYVYLKEGDKIEFA